MYPLLPHPLGLSSCLFGIEVLREVTPTGQKTIRNFDRHNFVTINFFTIISVHVIVMMPAPCDGAYYTYYCDDEM